jgi:glyoxylase I family protein
VGDITTTGLHHLRITVTDIERSKSFYSEVLGFEVAVQSQGDPSDTAVRSDPDQLFGGCVFVTSTGMLFGLRPTAPSDDIFNSERVGLDHISFSVAGRSDLENAIEALDGRGVPHGEVQELPSFGIAILSFDDPDGIHLELTAPL